MEKQHSAMVGPSPYILVNADRWILIIHPTFLPIAELEQRKSIAFRSMVLQRSGSDRKCGVEVGTAYVGRVGGWTSEVTRCWCILWCIVPGLQRYTLLNIMITKANGRTASHVSGFTVKKDFWWVTISWGLRHRLPERLLFASKRQNRSRDTMLQT